MNSNLPTIFVPLHDLHDQEAPAHAPPPPSLPSGPPKSPRGLRAGWARGEVLIAPTGIDGLDRLLSGGLRLSHRTATAPVQAATVAIGGPHGSGRTTLALHLSFALCRIHGRGAALYLCQGTQPEDVRLLLAGHGDAGFAWVQHGLAETAPGVATGLVLEPLGTDEPDLAAQVLSQVSRAQQDLPRETPLRAVVLDQVGPSSWDEVALSALLARLHGEGISVVLLGGGPRQLPDADVVLELSLFDAAAGGRALYVHKTRLCPAHQGPHLLTLGDGSLRVLPLPQVVPLLCRPPDPPMRALPLSRFGDPTLDQRAGGKPWLHPQSRVLLYGPDPTCTLLLANRFLAESPHRLALFFTAAAPRSPRRAGPEGPDVHAACDRGLIHLLRPRTGAEVVGQVAQVLSLLKRRWSQSAGGDAEPQAPRVALIDPGVLHADGHAESDPAVLDAALLSVCSEAGVMVLVARTCTELPPWWGDFDLVLHVPHPAHDGQPVMRVVVDQVAPEPEW